MENNDEGIRRLGDTDPGGSDISEHGEISPEEPVEVPKEEKPEEPEEKSVEGGTPIEGEKPEKEEKKESKGFQKRIDELVRQREDAKRHLVETEKDRNSWREQAIKKDGAEDKKGKVETKPSVDDFENYDDYIDALTDYKVSQAMPTIQEQFNLEKDKDRQNQKLQKTRDKLDAGRGKYDDFDAVAMNESVPYSQDMLDIITDSDDTADIAYYFGKNTSEAARVSGLPALDAAREIGKIEAKLSLGEIKPETKSETKKITSAPEVIQPVGGSGTVTKKPSEMTYGEYRRWRIKSKDKNA